MRRVRAAGPSIKEKIEANDDDERVAARSDRAVGNGDDEHVAARSIERR